MERSGKETESDSGSLTCDGEWREQLPPNEALVEIIRPGHFEAPRLCRAVYAVDSEGLDVGKHLAGYPLLVRMVPPRVAVGVGRRREPVEGLLESVIAAAARRPAEELAELVATEPNSLRPAGQVGDLEQSDHHVVVLGGRKAPLLSAVNGQTAVQQTA